MYISNTSNFSDFLRNWEREFLWRASHSTTQQFVHYLHDNNTKDEIVAQFIEKLNIENPILTIQENTQKQNKQTNNYFYIITN